MIDVRDAMESYWQAALFCKAGEAYNIGGTTSLSVGEFLEILKGLSSVSILSRVDPKLLRPADVTLQIPCTDKFTQATGWHTKYSFEESVEHLLLFCRRVALREIQTLNTNR
jgi:nucleoside-diphosphate-sugar epimerase